MTLSLAFSAAGDELFSWWERGLLDLSLEPGAWVVVEGREDDGHRAEVDTLRCDVLAAENGLRWLRMESSRSDDAWILSVEYESLRKLRPLVDSLRDLYRVQTGGALTREELSELKESQMFRRRLQDPFEDPEITRESLPDTLVHGQALARDRVVMSERREKRIPLGKNELEYSIELHSVAQMSAAIPIFGVLHSETETTERTVHHRLDERSPVEPPETQHLRRELRCLGFGQAEPLGLPAAIR